MLVKDVKPFWCFHLLGHPTHQFIKLEMNGRGDNVINVASKQAAFLASSHEIVLLGELNLGELKNESGNSFG